MSTFEKILIPFIEGIRPGDLTKMSGFVDSYTADPDKPSGCEELFLVYDCDIKNEHTIERARRFNFLKTIKREYIKYVNDKPLYVYSFFIKPELKKWYKGVLTLSTKEKVKILNFWTEIDPIVDYVLNNNVITPGIIHEMPLADYREEPFQTNGFTITKKGQPQDEVVPLFFSKYSKST